MTRTTLIAAAVIAALASPLVAADQSVEKATRYRATAPEAVSPILAEPMSLELDPLAELDPFSAFVWNDSSTQIEDLGCCFGWNVNAEQVEELGGSCCFIWNVNADQVEELGPYYWNQNTEQVEELGPYYWNQNTEQVEELGPYYWNQSTEQVEELGPYYWNQSTEQVEELGGNCCYIWAQNAAEIED